jgi:hypothetical protein
MRVAILDDYQDIFAGLSVIDRLRSKAEVQSTSKSLGQKKN